MNAGAILYEIRKRKEPGAPYVRHAIYVNGVQIHAQLSPYSEDEIEQRIAAYLNPKPAPKFDPNPKPTRPGPKPGAKRAASVNARGYLWKDEE